MPSYDVFISYSAKEFSEAEMLRGILEKNGIRCWMAPASIPGGSNYAKEIPAAIRNCKAFLLLLSKAAQESTWVPRELDLAVNARKVILPFMLEECELLDEFNFYLIGSQRFDAYKKKSEALERLIQTIRAIVSVTPENRITAETENQEPEPVFTKTPAQEWKKAVDDGWQPPVQPRRSVEAAAKALIGKDPVAQQGGGVFSRSKEKKLRAVLGVPDGDEVYLVHDDTIMRSGKNGFALCGSGIYVRGILESEATFVTWTDFLKAEQIQRDGSELFAVTGELRMRVAYVTGSEDTNTVVSFFNRLFGALKAEFN